MLSASRRPARPIAPTLLLVSFAGFAIVASIHQLGRAPTVAVVVPASTAPVIQRASNLEAQRITLRSTGFEPANVTRPARRFLLAVNDRSGRPDVKLVPLRSTGERVKEVRLRDTPRKHEWREVLTLPPGQYRLIDAANPEMACQIVLSN